MSDLTGRLIALRDWYRHLDDGDATPEIMDTLAEAVNRLTELEANEKRLRDVVLAERIQHLRALLSDTKDRCGGSGQIWKHRPDTQTSGNPAEATGGATVYPCPGCPDCDTKEGSDG